MKKRIIASLSILIIALMTVSATFAQDNREHFQQKKDITSRGTRQTHTAVNGYHTEKTYYGYRQAKHDHMQNKPRYHHTSDDFKHGDFDNGEEYDRKDINDHSDYNHYK